jgi:hypothetical protein
MSLLYIKVTASARVSADFAKRNLIITVLLLSCSSIVVIFFYGLPISNAAGDVAYPIHMTLVLFYLTYD